MKKIKIFSLVCFLFLLFWMQPLPAKAANKIDIIFIVDRSGSMSSSINSVRNEIGNFTTALQNQGISYRLGLVTYETYVSNYGLTTDVNRFKQWLNGVYVDGGTENGLDAIEDAAENTIFQVDAIKYFVLIGDEVVTSDRGNTINGIQSLLKNNKITLTAVGINSIRTQFESLSNATGGLYLDLYSGFGINLTKIFEQIQAIPQFDIKSPSSGSYFGGTKNTFIPTLSVTDADGDALTCKLYVDSESTPREIRTVTNTKTSQLVSFNTFNAATLSEGNHTLKFTVGDSRDTVQSSINIIVDKTVPITTNVSFSSTDNSIVISGKASDSLSGLDATPYRFSVGSKSTIWGTNTSAVYDALKPNTLYPVKFEAQDKVGNVAISSGNIYTKAQTPIITVKNVSENSIDLTLTDNNPSTTMYQIVSPQMPSAQWQTVSDKVIHLSNLQPGTQYSIQVKARNSENIETALSNQISCATVSIPPSNVEVLAGRNSMKISWSAVAGALRYEVELDGGSIISTGTNTSYTHEGLQPGTQHTYRVRTVNSTGVSRWSQSYTQYTIINPPTTPVNFDAGNVTNKLVSLEWDWVTDAFGYQIEINGSHIIDISNGNTRQYDFTSVMPDTTYTFRLRAVNVGGESPWTESLKITTLPDPPSIPKNIEIEVSKNTVKLSWPTVERAEAYWILVDGVKIDNGKNSTFIHENLTPLSGHTYKIKAVNRGGESEWSEKLDVTTWPEEPVTPTNILATSGKTSISLSWYKVPYAESYEIEIDGLTIKGVTDESYAHGNLSAGTNHTYRVRAKNISGFSEWSREITVSTIPADSNAVSLTNVVAVVTTNSIMLSWDAKAYEGKYDIEVDGIIYDNGTNTIYNHTGLKPDSYHTYRIRVRDRNGQEQWCTTLSLSTMPPLPDAPVNIQANPGNNSIELVWTRVEGTEGYDLEIDGETIENLTDSIYNHIDLKPGTSHTYRVRAKNSAGVTAWSPSITINTTSPTYAVKCKKDKDFEFSILADNVQDFSNMTFIVEYNPDELEIKDLYRGTPAADTMRDGIIPDTNLNVKFSEGRIEIKVSESIVPGTSWSGEITSLLFKAKLTGSTKIDLTVE